MGGSSKVGGGDSVLGTEGFLLSQTISKLHVISDNDSNIPLFLILLFFQPL